MSVAEQMRERIIELLQDVQGGKLGCPTVDDLTACGALHSILENELMDKSNLQ